MTTDLRDRLTELAELAPRGGPPADEIWTRGVRRARVRRAATGVVVAACAAVLVVAGLQVSSSLRSAPTPASSEKTLRLPTKFYTPSRWLPGTAGHPIGPLAAVIDMADRAGHTDATSYVGVSGVSGEYRMLDLPHDAGSGEGGSRIALSPDGRHLAYWFKGKPSSTEQRSVVGLAIYDTVTGKVRQHPMSTKYGLEPSALSWLDTDRVYFLAAQDRAVDASMKPAPDDWGSVLTTSTGVVQQVRATLPRPKGFRSVDTVSNSVAAGGRIILATHGDRAFVLDAGSHAPRVEAVKLPTAATGHSDFVLISPSGRHGSALRLGGAAKAPLQDFTTGSGGRERVVPRSRQNYQQTDLIGMPDDHHVLTKSGEIRSVDLRTGKSTLVSHLNDGYFSELTFAADAFAHTSVDRPAPPYPMDPRVRWGLIGGSGALLVLVVGAGVILRRRRAKQ